MPFRKLIPPFTLTALKLVAGTLVKQSEDSWQCPRTRPRSSVKKLQRNLFLKILFFCVLYHF